MSDRIDSNFYKKEDIENLNKIYKSKMQVKSLIDIANDIKDGPHDGYTFVDDGVLFIRSQNIKDAGFDLTDKKYITKEFHEKFKKSWLEVGDLLITRIGEYYGNAAVVSSEYKGCNINHAIAKIKLKKEYNPYYICAYVNSSIGNKIYRRLGKSFTSPRVNLNDYSDFIIPIPSPEIQKYIGDKVRKAEELREEAKRLKKEAEEILNNELNVKELLIKIDRYTEKHSWIMNSDINDRMDALYYNPQKITIKKFYKNYNLQKLKDLVDYKKGYAFKSEDYCNNTSTFLLRVSDISNNEVDMCNMLNLPDEFYQEYKDFNLINGDIVMVVTGNTTGKSIVINNNKFKLLLNQNAIRMRIKEGIDISPYYIELILQSQYFQTLLKYSLYQSVQPFISMEFLNDVVIPIIDKTKIENISNLYEKSLNNLFYAKQLIQEAKQDVEDLIEGNFDMSKVKANS